MNYKETGLPQDNPLLEKAFDYYRGWVDFMCMPYGRPNPSAARQLLDQIHFDVRVAAVMTDTGVAPALVAAYLMQKTGTSVYPPVTKADWIRQELGEEAFNNWRLLDETDQDIGRTAHTTTREEVYAQLEKLEHTPRPYKTVRLARYAAAAELYLEDEQKFLSKEKYPRPARDFLDGTRTLTDIFACANYGLQRRVEKDYDRLDAILTRAGAPPSPDAF